MERVQERHAGFRSLKEAVDTTTPAGRMMMQIVGAFAEFERAMLKERTKAGLDAARKEGRIGGRPPKLKPHQQQEIAGEEDRRRRGAPVRRPPGNGVAATPADLDRVFYRTFGSIAPQAPVLDSSTMTISVNWEPPAGFLDGSSSNLVSFDVARRSGSGASGTAVAGYDYEYRQGGSTTSGCLREGAKSYVKCRHVGRGPAPGHRYSPVRLMCSHPSGETWVRNSAGVSRSAFCLAKTASLSFCVFQ